MSPDRHPMVDLVGNLVMAVALAFLAGVLVERGRYVLCVLALFGSFIWSASAVLNAKTQELRGRIDEMKKQP